MVMNKEPSVCRERGVGFHYFPDTDHYSSQDLAVWLPELQSMGVSWLTMRSELGRAIPEAFLAPLMQAGITPIVHIPVDPIHSLDPDDLSGLLRAYANWGVQYVVVFDRANMRESWHTGAFDQAHLTEQFVDYWLPVARIQMEHGLRPVLPPLQQGGIYWDTCFLSGVIGNLLAEGAGTVIDELVLGVYSYAFANASDWGRGGRAAWPASQPYLTPPGSQDQLGFWSFDWYAEIFEEMLGVVPPMIMLAGGARFSERNSASDYRMELAWHTTCNASIARAMYAGHLPDFLLNVNFWLLSAAKHGVHSEDSWYPLGEKPIAITDELKRLATKLNVAGHQSDMAYLKSLAPEKPLHHYVLLPKFDWGAPEWHWRLAGPLVREDNASCGYSLKAAIEAARVTLIGDESEIGEHVVDQLQQAGCAVYRIKGEISQLSDSEELVPETVMV